MKHLKTFNENNSTNKKYVIKWELEDISGDCSPSGSTTLDSGEVTFYDISEKDSHIDEISNEFKNGYKTKLYGTFCIIDNDEVEHCEDIEFDN